MGSARIKYKQKQEQDYTNSVRKACLLSPSSAVNADSSTRERYATTLVKGEAVRNRKYPSEFFFKKIKKIQEVLICNTKKEIRKYMKGQFYAIGNLVL